MATHQLARRRDAADLLELLRDDAHLRLPLAISS